MVTRPQVNTKCGGIFPDASSEIGLKQWCVELVSMYSGSLKISETWQPHSSYSNVVVTFCPVYNYLSLVLVYKVRDLDLWLEGCQFNPQTGRINLGRWNERPQLVPPLLPVKAQGPLHPSCSSGAPQWPSAPTVGAMDSFQVRLCECGQGICAKESITFSEMSMNK